MVIYVDVLIFINAVTDFFLILASSKLAHSPVGSLRAVAGATVASLFSLYIFWPYPSLLTDALVRAAASAVTCFICIGRGSLKRFLRFFFCFYSVSFIYAGFVLAGIMISGSDRAKVNHGIVYFDVSPLLLIVTSIVFYFVFDGIKKLVRRDTPSAARCRLKLIFDNKTAEVTAIVDTGHDIKDPYGDGNMIIADINTAELLFGSFEAEKLKDTEYIKYAEKYRVKLIPIKTVSGSSLKPAIKLDGASAVIDGNEYGICDPYLITAEGIIGDDYSAILSPDAINNDERSYFKEVRA